MSSQLAWLASLKTGFNDFTDDQKFLRKVGPRRLPIRLPSPQLTLTLSQTSIIGTIGPKTNNVETLVKLMECGLNIGALQATPNVNSHFTR
jgi:pyruvate kinase